MSYKTINFLHFISVSPMIKIDLTNFKDRLKEERCKIIDIGGGGAGTIARLLNSPDLSVVDISWKELEGVKKKAPHPTYMLGDIYNLPFEDKTFDYATSFFTLMFLKEKKRAFSEIKRVLKKGGSFYIWDTDVPLSLIFVARLAVHIEDETITTTYCIKGRGHAQSCSNLCNALLELGYKIEKIENYDSIFLEAIS